jgi:hypothetical protein
VSIANKNLWVLHAGCQLETNRGDGNICAPRGFDKKLPARQPYRRGAGRAANISSGLIPNIRALYSKATHLSIQPSSFCCIPISRSFRSTICWSLDLRSRERGCDRLEWCVLSWNESAIGFYESLGAVPVRDWTVFHMGKQAIDELAKFADA